MRSTHPEFVLGANHALRHRAPDLSFLDNQRLLAALRVQRRPDRCHDDLLSGGHVGGTAHDVERTFSAYIHCRDAEFVGVGVFFAGQYLTDHDIAQAAFDGFDFLDAFHFQAGASQ